MADTTRTQTIERSAAPVQAQASSSACCGGPAPTGADACCAHDAEVKSTGGTGCGCGSATAPAAPAAKKTGCCS